ncbi:MAG TPA: hypothetical protein VK483_09630 [Chitinophagaceae bacterium]|nr:hypothetical protein [Chitinophagaceae bacterium]
MLTTMTYNPDSGIILNEIDLKWYIEREVARNLLGNSHTPADQTIEGTGIHQQRDIYENYNNQENYFFLNYNSNRLSEIEIHNGFEITIKKIVLSFDKNISEIISELQTISPEPEDIITGEYFFKELKLSIADAEAMGGDGNHLSYFYCAANTDHLINKR